MNTMEIRSNGQHLYFLLDDHLVYRYTIQSFELLTRQELRKKGDTAVYELESKTHFYFFNHLHYEPKQGLGIFLGEESMEQMVHAINKKIKELTNS